MNAGAEYLVFEKTEDMWQFMAERWRNISARAGAGRGFFAAALSGGKTPVGFYHHLSLVQGLPWDSTHVFLADERLVPPDSPESNYGMLKRTLLNRVPIPQGNIHPVPTEAPSAIASAERYEQEMRTFFRLSGQQVPCFSLILLGVGEDGHAASLFPGTETLKEQVRWASPVVLGTSLHNRVTLTLPVINRAENVCFLVSGKRKRVIMKKLREGHDKTLPAAMVRPEKGTVLFLMDREAAG